VCIQSDKVDEESKRQAQEADFPQSGAKCTSSHVQGEGIHAGLARILFNSGYEEHNRWLERLAPQKNTNVYLEAMEETENEG